MSYENLSERIIALEIQVERMISDIESEKGTRARANEERKRQIEKIEVRLFSVEKSLWFGVGALAAFELVLKLIFK